MPKSLSELLSALPQHYTIAGDADTLITAPVVESDADVLPGGVFVARTGLVVDGHDFIPRALERGAAAVVGERPITDLPVPYVQVANPQEAVGFLAAAYHDFPSRKLTVIGVTGTDGKTTTSTLIHSILDEALIPNASTPRGAGLISTVAAYVGDKTLDTGLHVTTPGAPQIQALLAQMVANGLRYAVLEMTSQGLEQGRLNGVDLDVAVLTNITHDHLDYHKTFENYRAAKGRMFAMLSQSYRKPNQPKISIVNADDRNAWYFASFSADRVVTYSVHNEKAQNRATDIRYLPTGTSFDIIHREEGRTFSIHVETPLLGEFNVHNATAAALAARNLGKSADAIRRGIAQVSGIPGRMERIDEGQAFLALVDFAHTPNALENVLKACRKMTSGRVIVVFGCAGLRDRDKRRLMPEIATRLADLTLLTAEDPRTESLDAILETMAESAVAAGGIEGTTFIRVPDRGEALFRACQSARPGDLVVACGKGHEQSMAFGTVEYPWDDREALRAALRGTPLKTLPTANSTEY
jgi:UDP-N-acetylmuramoyl-L-alanyl-D-glutamate--2,6-diaminopimelate ligase